MVAQISIDCAVSLPPCFRCSVNVKRRHRNTYHGNATVSCQTLWCTTGPLETSATGLPDTTLDRFFGTHDSMTSLGQDVRSSTSSSDCTCPPFASSIMFYRIRVERLAPVIPPSRNQSCLMGSCGANLANWCFHRRPRRPQHKFGMATTLRTEVSLP